MNKKEQVVRDYLAVMGIDYTDVISTPIDEAVRQHAREFMAIESEVERGIRFGMTAMGYEQMKRQIVRLVSEGYDSGQFAASLKNLPLAMSRKVKDYFAPYFPDFDDGAAKALGRRFKPIFEDLTSRAEILERQGEAVHIANAIMKSLGKSRSPFFLRIIADGRRELFRRHLIEYVRMFFVLKANAKDAIPNEFIEMAKRRDGYRVAEYRLNLPEEEGARV